MLKDFISLPVQAGRTHKEEYEISAFVTPQRKCEFRQMPFGMCNALASFQRAMHIMNWSHAVGIIRTNELHNFTGLQLWQRLRYL